GAARRPPSRHHPRPRSHGRTVVAPARARTERPVDREDLGRHRGAASHLGGLRRHTRRTNTRVKELTMDARLDLAGHSVGSRVVKYIVSANKVVADSTLPAATQELVKIRASQINGCGYCVDMHTKDATRAGETSARLNLVAAWREATVFTEAERAALELAEQG